MTRKLDSHLLLALALSAFAWLPLVTPGYFMHAHDAPHALFFLQAFDEVIRDGHWWPAWGPHFAFGYGYPLWIFYAPLAYYLGEAFHLLGASITTAMKLVDLLATVGATFSMYLWARHHFGKPAAAFAAVIYTYAPYHLLDLYVRSSVAEYFASVFFPLVLWRWEVLLQSPSRRNTILAALVTAGLILTHHGAAFIFAGLLGAYVLFLFGKRGYEYTRKRGDEETGKRGNAETRKRRQTRFPIHSFPRPLVYILTASLLTLGLSAIFWLPMLLEQKYIVVEQWTSVAYNYQKHFVFFSQFFSPFWDYGYSGEGLEDGIGFQLGLMPIVGGIVALLSLRAKRSNPVWRALRATQGNPHTLEIEGDCFTKNARNDKRPKIIFFLVASIVSVLMMLPVSAAFWNAVPLASLVQFPWRLLALSTITLAWLSGAAIEAVQSPKSEVPNATGDMGHWTADVVHPLTALFMLTVALASFNYTLPQYTERSVIGESARASVDFELVSYKDRTGYMTWASAQPSTSPLVAEYQAGAPLTRAVALSANAQIESLHQGGESQRVRVRASGESVIQFRVYYFPGWRANIDGQTAPLWPAGPQALITLAVPSGEHVVEIRFEDTNVRGTAKLVSLVSLLVVVGWASWKGKRRGTPALSGAEGADSRPPSAIIVLVGLASVTIFLTACGTDAMPTPTPPPSFVLALTPPASPSPTTTNTATPTLSSTSAPTATVATTPRPSTIQHTVHPNETLLAIAQMYGTTVEALLKANNLSDPRLLRAGQTLIIPLPTVTPTATATATPDATQAALPPTPTPNIYIVQPNDVLSGIAAKYNIPVDEIMAANGMKDTFLRAGQPLVIPPPTATPTLTPTPLPTSTSTPALPFGAPVLLYPPDGATFNGDVPLVLNWTAVGVLADDQYYALRARKTDGSLSMSVWIKTPSFRLPDNWRGAKIEWDVIVLQLTKTYDDGTREGKILSPFSQTRTFTWK